MSGEVIEAEVAILGAGPAGTAAALRLGQLGVKGAVIVDKADFPRDKTCGSGISPRGIEVLRTLGVWDRIEPESYRINGIRIVTPGGYESYQSAGATVEAVVCQRRVLDHTLLKEAVSLGARFVPDFTASSLIEEGGRVRGFVAKDGRTVRARYTVIAGGTHLRLGVSPRPRRLVQAIMGWWDGVPFRPNVLEMVFDRSIAPYYGWLFPESDERVNIGITYWDPGHEKNARSLFQNFLDKHYGQRLAGARQVGGWKGHPVAHAFRIESLWGPGRVIVGEAGLMTHPSTAEGIYQAMYSGMRAAEAIADIVASRLREDDAFTRYERGCQKRFLPSFLAGGAMLGLVQTPVFEWLVRAGDSPMVKSAASKLLATV
ncbi:NAD(P)/FAD-dependent oxidoreductase [Polyangium aurulentum]|uniref:NAD(P)/FAD-dependent oxidoreductase n=1 Tax=Polyangium aurulentum TaxID=2567896 RepID=UPI00146DC6BD|nr:FAD-dependent monooxygenase [Polyangium aurulentum]UQA55161.1 FAD-dependent monooxygenase [Polyangium aurulentum]